MFSESVHRLLTHKTFVDQYFLLLEADVSVVTGNVRPRRSMPSLSFAQSVLCAAQQYASPPCQRILKNKCRRVNMHMTAHVFTAQRSVTLWLFAAQLCNQQLLECSGMW